MLKRIINLSRLSIVFFLTLCLNLYAATQDNIKTNINSSDKETYKLFKFQKRVLSLNHKLKIKRIDLVEKGKVDNTNFNFYILNITAVMTDTNKENSSNITVFSNGKYMTNRMYDMDLFKPWRKVKAVSDRRLGIEAYNKRHLLYGDANALNKIVIFGSTLSLSSKNKTNLILKYFKDSQDVAIYYYEIPSDYVYTASTIVSQAIVVAKQKGVKDVVLKLYDKKIDHKDEMHNVDREIKPEVVLYYINKILGTNITINEATDPTVVKIVKYDKDYANKLNVKKIPTIFINGEYDKSNKKLFRLIFEQKIKEKGSTLKIDPFMG